MMRTKADEKQCFKDKKKAAIALGKNKNLYNALHAFYKKNFVKKYKKAAKMSKRKIKKGKCLTK